MPVLISTPDSPVSVSYTHLDVYKRQAFLKARGVDPNGTPESCPRSVPTRTDAALLTPSETLEAVCELTFSNNVALMHTITADDSFAQLLESARSEKRCV